MRLSPVADQKRLRFHDLRHSTATLLLKAGVPLATVQRILRHTDPKITAEVYGHLDLDDMREGLNRLHLAPTVTERDRLAASLLLDPADPKREGPEDRRKPEEPRGLQRVGATGFEPATTCTPTPPTPSVNVGRVWQLFARRGDSGLGTVDAFVRIRRVSLES